MKLNVSDLTTDRLWRSNTGLSKEKFYDLLVEFSKSYQEIYGKSMAERQAKGPSSPTFTR